MNKTRARQTTTTTTTETHAVRPGGQPRCIIHTRRNRRNTCNPLGPEYFHIIQGLNTEVRVQYVKYVDVVQKVKRNSQSGRGTPAADCCSIDRRETRVVGKIWHLRRLQHAYRHKGWASRRKTFYLLYTRTSSFQISVYNINFAI